MSIFTRIYYALKDFKTFIFVVSFFFRLWGKLKFIFLQKKNKQAAIVYMYKLKEKWKQTRSVLRHIIKISKISFD